MSDGNGNSTGHFGGEHIVRRMTELGFEPSSPLSPMHVEFSQDFAEADGRQARVRVRFDKPAAGLAGVRLGALVVTVQKTFAPDRETIEREAPRFIKDQLLEVVDLFGDADQFNEASVADRVCVKCNRASAEFYVVNGDAVCKGCVQARKAGR